MIPSPAPSSYSEFDDRVLKPVAPKDLGNPTRELTLEVLLETMDNGINRGMFNSVTWNAPLVPSLLTALTMGNSSTDQRVYGPATVVFQPGEIVDLVIVNLDDNSHPL